MENLQPRIRFKGFYGDWEKAKLKDIADINMGQSPNSENYTDDDSYPVLIQGNQDIKNGKVVPRIYTKEITKKAEKNDLILTVRAPVGEVAVNSYNSVIGRGVCSIKGNKFIYYDLFKKKDHYWDKLSSGSTFKSINSNDIKNSKINYPSLKEQEKIGDLFERLDLLIEKQEKYLALNKKLKKSLLQKLFPKKGEDYPELRFLGFSKKWTSFRVGDIFKVTRGNVLSKKKIKPNPNNKFKYPVYSSQTLNNGLLGFFDKYLFEDSITWTTDGANAGTVNFRQGKFYSTNVNGVLISKEGYSNRAVSEALNTVAYKYVSRVGNPKLMNNTMEDIIIKLPSLKEQEKIGSLFKSLDEKIKNEEERLSSYKDLKKSLLQKIFV